jgi:D-alanyl-D-alanine carboxypeptidase
MHIGTYALPVWSVAPGSRRVVVVTQPIIVSGRRAVLAVLSVVIVACSSVGSDDAITTSSSTTSTAGATATSAPVTEPAVEDDLLSQQLAGITVLEGRGAAMVALVEADGAVSYVSKGSDPIGSSLSSDAVFRVGSITKMFTAVLVLTLVEDGAVDLDAPATGYVTRVDIPEGVTVRDLLQHTSGVPNYTDGPDSPVMSFLDDPERVWSPEEIVALVRDRAPRFEPGARFSYSNTNYAILGVLVEEVTGMPFAEVLRARILDPLGLDATYLAGFEEGQEPFGAYFATSDVSEPIDFPYASIATSAWAAGALVSSVEDLHTFLTALFDEHVISAELLAAMTANEEYGLGITRLPGFDSLYGHGGGIPGYTTFVLHAPDTGKTAFWVATNNTAIFDPPIDELAAHLDS